MKISEMIDHLNELKNKFGDKEVVLSVTDHTDWTYILEHPSFEIDNVYDDDEEFDMDEEYCVCSISI